MKRFVGLASVAVLMAGCGISGMFGPQGGPYPGACADLGFAGRQCAAMVARAETLSGVKATEAASVDILPPIQDGVSRIGGYMISRVRFRLPDATEETEEIWCIGIARGGDDACISDPMIYIGGRRVDRDMPCTGNTDPPTGCATEPPTPRPEIRAQARPLRVPVLDIPLDHLGSYRIEVGEAGLPDGAFTESSASFADEHPTNFWLRDADLVIEPVDPTRPPIGSIFRDPFDGVEQVRVSLQFDVTELSPGAILQVRDILVE
jgi:hypothetical protein